MITVKPSHTADSRTCDFKSVSRETLLNSSVQHIKDVQHALQLFVAMLGNAMTDHDTDKITDIDGFHEDFVIGIMV